MRTSLRAIATPTYAILATLSGLLALWLILWSVNFSALTLVLVSSKVPTGEKIGFSLGIFQNFLINFNAAWVLVIIFLSAGFGIGLSTLVYLWRHSHRTPYDIAE